MCLKRATHYLTLWLIIWLTGSAHAQIDSTSASGAEQRTRIQIASEPDYPPYCIVNENGQAAGFSVDLFKASAAAVGLDVDIRIGMWNKIKQDLARGRIDALPLVGRTPEREPLFDFTFPYMSLHGAIFVRKGTTNIQSVEDLKGKEIIVMKGDNAEEFVRRENVSDKIITTFTFEAAFRKLAAGNHDAVITQRVMGLQLLDEMNIKSIIPLDIPLDQFRQDFCFAVQQGDAELLSRLSEGLSIVVANGTFDELHRQWFSPAIKKQLSFKDILIIALYILIPSLIIYTVVLVILLRSQVKNKTADLRQEISEREKTEQQLQKQHILLKEMEKVTKVGGWEYDAATGQISWTDGVYAIYEVSPSEFDPSDKDQDITFYPDKDRELLDQAFQRALDHAEPYDLELRFNTGRGVAKWVRTIGKPQIKDGKVIRLYGNILDITDRKLAEEKILETQRQMSTLLGNLPGMAYRCKNVAEWTMEFVSNGCERLTGYTAEDIVNDTKVAYAELIHPDDRDMVWNEVQQALQNRQQFELEYRIRTREKKEKWVWERGTGVFAEHGEVTLIEGFISDITVRKHALDELVTLKNALENKVTERTAELEDKVHQLDKSKKAMLYMVEDLNNTTRELEQRQKELETANKELEAFSYSVSHDLRAPLRAITGFSRILYDEYHEQLDDAAQELINDIVNNSVHMSHLIDDLLKFSRMSRAGITKQLINMNHLFEQSFEELTANSTHDDIEFNVHDLPQGYGDYKLIKQVVMNLLSNAIKFTGKIDSPVITIEGKKKNGQCVYSVSDNGAGFDDKYVHKLFGVFQRLHDRDEFEGTGVGLAIIQRIITRHGGTVRAQGKTGQGATFYFTLPNMEKPEPTKG